jgi:hypothetical protein
MFMLQLKEQFQNIRIKGKSFHFREVLRKEKKGKENYDDPPPAQTTTYVLLKMSDSTGPNPTSGKINLPVAKIVICVGYSSVHIWLWAGQSVLHSQQVKRDFSLLCNVQTKSGSHPASYTMGTKVSFPWGKAVGE